MSDFFEFQSSYMALRQRHGRETRRLEDDILALRAELKERQRTERYALIDHLRTTAQTREKKTNNNNNKRKYEFGQEAVYSKKTKINHHIDQIVDNVVAGQDVLDRSTEHSKALLNDQKTAGPLSEHKPKLEELQYHTAACASSSLQKIKQLDLVEPVLTENDYWYDEQYFNNS
jgi:hypothetical protein